MHANEQPSRKGRRGRLCWRVLAEHGYVRRNHVKEVEESTGSGNACTRCRQMRREGSGESKRKVVEAAGVEPASENVTGQETTCLFRFMP